MELNRSRRRLPADLLPELWAVVGLLCVAGLFAGIPVLQHLPDAFSSLTKLGLWDSFGLLVLVLLFEVGFFAVACFVLAWQLTQGDTVARVVTVVVSGSLAFGLLVGGGLDDGSSTVTMVCSALVVVCLTVPPRARAFFAGRPPGAAPTTVVAAEALVVIVSGVLLAVGVAFLPLVSVKAKYGFAGVALAGIAVVCLKDRRRLGTGDPGARVQVSVLMGGAVLAILLGHEGSLTGPLFIPLGMAVAIVGLVWLAPDSQAFFTAGGSLAVDDDDDRGASDFGASGIGDRDFGDDSVFAPASDPTPPPPRPAPSRVRTIPAPTSQLPTTAPPSPFAPASPPPPPPPLASARSATPLPAPSPSAPDAGRATASPRVPPPPPIRTPDASPAPGSVASPPRWLLDAPPAGFWPPERRRGDPHRYELVEVDATLSDELRVAPELGIRFDTVSWFPVLEGREQVKGAYLVSMAMFDDAGAGATAFRGTSTLLVTSARLVGVCARGDSAAGPLGPGSGRVAVWRVLLDHVDWVRAEGSAEGGHLALRAWDSERPWALLAKPRVAVEGAFTPSRLADLADLVNRAKHTSA